MRPLQERGVVRSRRGRIEVLDRAGLESRACECYRAVADDYERLVPRVRQLFSVENEPLVLRADICRRELLVEIEGTYALE